MISKKYLILGGLGFVIIMAAIVAAFIFKQYKQVTFTLTYPQASANLLEPNNSNPVATVSNNSSVWLKKQTYTVQFTDSNLTSTQTNITVDDNTSTITLDPSLSDTALSNMLTNEKQAIDKILKDTVKSSKPYTETKRQLYHQGEWCALVLKVYYISSNDPGIGNPESVDTYYMVLKKTNNTWGVAAGPSLILTKPDNPSIPGYIIEKLNPV